MVKLLSKLFPKSRKRIKPGLQDGRRWRIYEAGWMALNASDHEDVSVTQIAKDAGVSVGAFYRRFRDRTTFLDFVVFHRLHWAKERTTKALDPSRWRRASDQKVVSGLVRHLVETLHGDMRGTVRTAYRRRRPGREGLCPLASYQALVADASVKLMLERLGGGQQREEDIRAGVQVVLATLLGSLLKDHGPLGIQRQRTVDALSEMMGLQLGLDWPRGGSDKNAPNALIDLPAETIAEASVADIHRALETENKTKAVRSKPPVVKAAPRRLSKRVHLV